MRPSLEHLGRFDPTRARLRLVEGFDPSITKSIDLDGQRVGFYVLQQSPDGASLDHLYILPSSQGSGIGSQVMQDLISLVNGPIKVGALKGSDSNRFYLRHGFEKVDETEWDMYYVRPYPCRQFPSSSG